MATRQGHTRMDLGRLIMVPVAAATLVIDVTTLIHRSGAVGPLRSVGTVAVCVFYAVIIRCYLRRAPARASSRSRTAHAAAIVATCAPFVFPLLPAVPADGPRQLAADILLIAGTVWSVWTLRFLGRSLSVLAQARDLVDSGPYRWVRHPLYAGEIVSSLGLVIMAGTVPAVAAWGALCLLQGYRAIREEQVLLSALPGYRAYRSRTAALLPGLF